MENVTNTTRNVYDRHADAQGAMEFTVSVVMVYGGAVFGVLILGFFRGLSNNHDDEDKQVNYFLRDIEKTRRKLTKERDLSAVYKTLEGMDVEWKSFNNRDTGSALGRGLANMMALPVMLSRENEANMVRKKRRPPLKRLKSLPRVFTRLKSSRSQSDPYLERGLRFNSQIEERVLMENDENIEDTRDGDTSTEIRIGMTAMGDCTEESDCGSFQSTFSYLV